MQYNKRNISFIYLKAKSFNIVFLSSICLEYIDDSTDTFSIFDLLILRWNFKKLLNAEEIKGYYKYKM